MQIPSHNFKYTHNQNPSPSQGHRYEAYTHILPSRKGMTAPGSEIKLTGDRGLPGGMSSFEDEMAKIRKEFGEKLKFTNSSVKNGTMSLDERDEIMKDLNYKQKPVLERLAKIQEIGSSKKRTSSSEEERAEKKISGSSRR